MFYKEYEACMLCPRKCGASRSSLQKGTCGETDKIRVGRAALHHWEEPCISGENGSGTVFFAGCNLKCCYCQNYALSRGEKGVEVNEDELKNMFSDLQTAGAHNINLVTAEHFAPQIKEAVQNAKKEGLTIPVILNSSGYVSNNAMELLRDVIDIYLVDFKYMDSRIAKEYSLAPDYPDVAKAALSEMVSLKNELQFDENGLLKSGVMVRHLCLPGHTDDSKRVIEYVFSSYGEKVGLSIMNQYTPMPQCKGYPQLKRKLTQKEYDDILDYCLDIGIENAYIQDGEAASESFIPQFQGK